MTPQTISVNLQHPQQRLDDVREVFKDQANALNTISTRVGDEMIRAMELMLSAHGRVIVTGMGKSGIIGKKISATLVMGDALAIALINARGFLPNDFARFHPGGSLGRKLLTRVRDIMHVNYARLKPTDEFMQVMSAITKTRLGLATVVDADGKLVGVISDGDLLRAMQPPISDRMMNLLARDIMTSKPVIVPASAMFTEAAIGEDLRRGAH